MINELIKNIFSPFELESEKEALHIYQISFHCSELNLITTALNENNYNLLNDALKQYNYSWNISIDELDYYVSQKGFKPVDTTNDSFDVVIELQIHKKSNHIIIFNGDIFNNFIKNLTFENLLLAIKEKSFPITFINDSEYFQHDYDAIEMGNSEDDEIIKTISLQCNFRNYSQLSFSPNIFYLPDLGYPLTIIEEKLKKLCLFRRPREKLCASRVLESPFEGSSPQRPAGTFLLPK